MKLEIDIDEATYAHAQDLANAAQKTVDVIISETLRKTNANPLPQSSDMSGEASLERLVDLFKDKHEMWIAS